MGLYTPTILGGNSYLSWIYDRGAIKDPSYTGTSKGLSHAINRVPIGKFLPKYANVYVTIQSHGLSTGARTQYATVNGVRNGLGPHLISFILHVLSSLWTLPQIGRCPEGQAWSPAALSACLTLSGRQVPGLFTSSWPRPMPLASLGRPPTQPTECPARALANRSRLTVRGQAAVK